MARRRMTWTAALAMACAAAAPAPPPTVVALPGTVSATAVGGAGRYLILHVPKARVLAVVDCSTGTLAKLLPLPSDDVTFTAGATKLYVGLRDLRLIQSYDLAKLEADKSYAAPACGVGTLAMGAESAGPLLLLGADKAKRFLALNPQTLRADPYPSKNWGTDGSAWGPVHIHVSFDGSAVVASGGGWAGIELTELVGTRVAALQAGGYTNGDALVSGNGSLVFEGDNIFRSDLSSKVSGGVGRPFPADDASFSCALVDAAEAGEEPGKPNKKKGRKAAHKGGGKALAVFNNADPRPLLTLTDVPELSEESKLPVWERVHLIPRQHVLAVVSGDKLVLRPFDLGQLLAANGAAYLYVDSAPPALAVRGQGYVYAMHAESSGGPAGLAFELQSHPAGMSMSKAGVIRWGVPSNYPQESATVVVRVVDITGQSVFHAFTVTLGLPPPPPRTATAADQPTAAPAVPILRPGIHLGFK